MRRSSELKSTSGFINSSKSHTGSANHYKPVGSSLKNQIISHAKAEKAKHMSGHASSSQNHMKQHRTSSSNNKGSTIGLQTSVKERKESGYAREP